MSSQPDFKSLTKEQKEKILEDKNNNNIPDIFENGVLPEDLGIDTGAPMDAQSVESRRKTMKLMGKFVSTDSWRKRMGGQDEPGVVNPINSGKASTKPDNLIFRILIAIVASLLVYWLIKYFFPNI